MEDTKAIDILRIAENMVSAMINDGLSLEDFKKMPKELTEAYLVDENRKFQKMSAMAYNNSFAFASIMYDMISNE